MDSNSPQDQQEVFWDNFQIFYRRKWFILIPILLGLGAGLVSVYLTPKEYRSSTVILVEEQRVPQEFVRSTVTASIEDRLKTISQQVMSRTNLLMLIDIFDFYSDQKKTLTEEGMVKDFRSRIELDVIGNTAFSLSFSGEEPSTVMKITGALASGYIEKNLIMREDLAKVTTEFLQEELSVARRRLEKLDKGLELFKEKNMGGGCLDNWTQTFKF